MYDICVFAGRMRPFHAGHMTVIKQALQKAQYLFVIVGSVGEPINFRNPFTFEEVREMIRASLTPTEQDRVFILGIADQENDNRWVAAVQKCVTDQAKAISISDPKIALIGYSKDGSSYYLTLFPQWGSISVTPASPELHGTLDATKLRKILYDIPEEDNAVETLVRFQQQTGETIFPRGTFSFLREWVSTERFNQMRREYHFMNYYLDQFSQEPYPRYFTAADACVIMAGHVLLVRRGQMPGEGLWALPGGHVGMDETFEQAALRELVEETDIDVNLAILALACKGEKLLDNPWRSTRKRTISVAYGFDLTSLSMDLPLVRGQDDASVARWWPIDEVTREMMFEDHFNVIDHFATRFNSVL
jgi:bifunctional NMN adenylyltransferase/nudix hydrolase